VSVAALELRPRLFLMENVPGMQSVKREDLSFPEAAARTLQQRGSYRTEIWRLNASAFGVPQDRIRCFLVASRLPVMPARPPEEYQALGAVPKLLHVGGLYVLNSGMLSSLR
jgi:DNA (cytosine-5)-methyltransferase 1